MPFVWLGTVLVLMKWLEVGPVANLDWWWVLAPLGVALVWFEGLERLFGRDKRQMEMAEWEKQQKDRVGEAFKTTKKRR